ncbi:hypothetical protein NDU88_007781 [Pleurodeles waltl]|uniref:Uncharacterized protein n=1 Tax=Pleurodeles waltl TaxID=8319 RepID=A0AAV7U2H8_PLEWA|nr:hypothetical protein NDU88_007781 [Pleurodeles waltl]
MYLIEHLLRIKCKEDMGAIKNTRPACLVRNNFPRPRRLDLTDAAARSGPGWGQRCGPCEEPSGEAVGTADPCVQVRRDTPVVGGEGGLLRGRPRRCRPSQRRVLEAPNLTRIRDSDRRETGPSCRARNWRRGLTAIQLRTRKGPRYGTDEDRRDLPLRAAAQ